MGRPIEQVSAPGFLMLQIILRNVKNLIDIITADSKLLNKTISSIGIEIVENICREIVGPSGKRMFIYGG